MSAENFMAIHLLVVGIFQSELKSWIDRPTLPMPPQEPCRYAANVTISCSISSRKRTKYSLRWHKDLWQAQITTLAFSYEGRSFIVTKNQNNVTTLFLILGKVKASRDDVAKNPISLDHKRVLWPVRSGKCASWQRRQHSSLLMGRWRCFSTRCTNAWWWLQLKGETCQKIAATETAFSGDMLVRLCITIHADDLVLPNKTVLIQVVTEMRNTLQVKF